MSKHGFYWHSESNLKPRIPLKEFRDFTDLYPPHVLSFVRYYLKGSVEKSLKLNEVAELLMTLVGWNVIGTARLDEYSNGIVQVISDSNIEARSGVLILEE